jgi:hypothetical protein
VKIQLTIVVWLWSLGWLAITGCAGKGDIIPVNIPAKQVSAGMVSPQSEGLRVAIEPFSDSRAQKSRLGVRSHLSGGESYFEVSGNSSNEAATQALAQFVNSKGWNAHIVRPGRGSQAADLTISGHVLTLSVDAKSDVGSTKLMTASKIVIRALNHADGSVVRMTLNGTGSDSVFWFEPEDAQRLVNEVLNDSFAQLIQSTRVEGKLLRLREQAG